MRRLGGLLRALSPTMLLTAVPFALLVNSSQVRMRLEIERDGSARRSISATVAPYFEKEVSKWVGDVEGGAPWQRVLEATAGGDGASYTYARDFRTQNLNRHTANGELTIEDVFQNPLSLYTTYTWREEVSFSYLYATDPSIAGAGDKQLIYEITMPGRMLDATVTKTPASKATGTPVAPAPAPEAAPEPTPAPTPPPAPTPTPAAAPTTQAAPTPAPAPAAPTAPAAPATPPAAAPSLAPQPAPATPPASKADQAPPPKPGRSAHSSADIEAGTAVFRLDASEMSWTVEATSRRVRWGYLAIVVYVLAFVVYKVLQGLQRAATRRPRKI